MATNYPGSIDNSTSLPYPSSGNFTNGPSLAAGQDNQNDAIIATQTKLGTGSSTPTNNQLLIGTGVGSSSWNKTAPTGVIVGTTDTQTLTNKTFTSPTINNPIISNGTITADAITGFTSANSGSIYGVVIASGAITGANAVNGSSLVAASVPASAIVAGSLTSTQIATNGIAASNLATNAIALGYSQITTTFNTTSASFVQVTGLSTSVTIPAGGRRVKITAYCANLQNSSASSGNFISIWDGTVGTGTQLTYFETDIVNATFQNGAVAVAIVTPSAGAKTYNVGARCTAGTLSVNATSTSPAFILVETI